MKKKVANAQKLQPIPLPSTQTHFEFFVAHQLELSLTLITLILFGYGLELPYFNYFVKVQGKTINGLYEKTWMDLAFIFFYFLVFTFLRTFLLDYVFVPFIRWYGVKNKGKQEKFKEQAFSSLFYTISWLSGMHLLVNSNYYMNFENLWRGYPHLELDFYFKTYYLVQTGYWLQQMYFVQIEVRRKDYLNMITHHVITNSLVVFSYITNYTRVGHVMLVLMDFADIFLSTAKVLNYLRLKLICDITFTIFFISWIASRHIGFGMVMWSIMFDPEKVNPNEKWDPKNGIFYTFNIRRFFLVLLTALQILMFVWLWMILRVLIKVIVGTGAEDVRSSDEDDDVEHETKALNEKKKA